MSFHIIPTKVYIYIQLYKLIYCFKVEQIGSGITRNRDVMNDVGLTPPEFNIEGMFTVILRRPIEFEK